MSPRNRHAAFSFVEIIVGILVFGLLSLPVIWVVQSSRTETSKAINYLRALELAQETLEWVLITPINADYDKRIAALSGSLVKNDGGKFSPSPINISSNDLYPTDAKDLAYSDQYGNAFFYRNVEVKPVTEGPNKGLLKKVTVTIRWSEGKVPGNLETSDEKDTVRSKKVSLSVLIVDKNQVF